MSWIISNDLMKAYENSRSLQEPEVGFSVDTYLDGEQSAQSSGMNTPLLYCAQDKMKGFSRLSRSGRTFSLLTENLGEDLLTWYRVDSLAQIFPALEEERELKAQHQECGSTWRESLAKYDLDTHSWKTAQCSLLGGLELFSETWPRSGTMRNGVAYQARSLEQTTNATESGSWLPTPTCHNAKEGAYPAEYARNTPTLATHVGGKIHPEFTGRMMGWPFEWTDLKPLGTDKFQSWLQAHSFS